METIAMALRLEKPHGLESEKERSHNCFHFRRPQEHYFFQKETSRVIDATQFNICPTTLEAAYRRWLLSYLRSGWLILIWSATTSASLPPRFRGAKRCYGLYGSTTRDYSTSTWGQRRRQVNVLIVSLSSSLRASF